MATTTPNFGWDIPQSTDLVKDGATAIAALGNDIDTALIDLKGGTTGQVLSKASNTDLDFSWVAQDDSNAIQNALLTTTGDTIYASGASTPARLGIGSTGQVLTVAGGVPSWATPSSDKPSLTPKIATNYMTLTSRVGYLTVTLSEDTTYFTPMYLPGYAFDRISIRSAGTHSGTSTVRLGLYNASTTTGLPSTVYLDAGTVSATATSATYEITISSTPPAGYYYLAMNVQSLTGTANFQSFSDGSNEYPEINFYSPPLSTFSSSTYTYGFTESGITGAFATAGTLSNYTAKLPRIGLRMA